MKKLLSALRGNDKICTIKKTHKESLEDEVDYDKFIIVLNTNRNLFEWAKSIQVKPFDGIYEIEMYLTEDPNKTILKDLYLKHKLENWKAPRYGHDKPYIKLKGDYDVIRQLINYFYSKIN